MKKSIKYLIIVIVSLGCIAFAYPNIYGNFHQIDENAFRSGQLNKYNLPYYVEKYEIKTIVNLRGPSSKDWYKEEKQIAKNLGIAHIDIDMKSSEYYDYNQTLAILEILKNVEKPFLIHCLGGADRTSFVAAIYEYGINKKEKDIAKEQMSWYYGHLPFFKEKVKMMGNSFDNFVQVHEENI